MRGLTGESGDGSAAGWARAVAECAVVTAAFAAVAAWPAPDVNEAVYLTKARHAVDPAWGQGDFFLETPDAHGIFYRVAGPLAAALPLPQAAWIGRIAGWALLAIGFRQATIPLIAAARYRVLAALLFSFALRTTTAAGEWVIGGCEAKVFAWAAALGCIGAVAAARFPEACFRGGIATAFHPIVGGWTLVATLATWLVELGRPAAAAGSPRGGWPAWTWRGVALLAGGVAAAALGLVPALGLTAGVDAATRAAATKIYVVERLSHHLLPRTFADGMIARHLLAAAAWWLLSRVLTPTPARRRIAVLTWVSLGISAVGVAISLLEPWAPTITYSLLRYYWFRLADVMVPFALATAFAAALSDAAACGRLTSWRPAWLRAAVVGLLGVDLAVQSLHWPLPGRTTVTARADSKVAADAWADICDWVRDHTAADACFLTPRGAASFTWRTGRREVVSWKNSPQDAASLVAWRQRIVDCFSRSGSLVEMERSTAALGPERLRQVAERYAADHVIVPIDTPLVDAIPGERLHANGTYAVYRLTPP